MIRESLAVTFYEVATGLKPISIAVWKVASDLEHLPVSTYEDTTDLLPF